MSHVVAVVGCRLFFYRVRFSIVHFFFSWKESPHSDAEVKIAAEVLRMKAEEKKALGSANSASGDAELVSGVLVTVNGESLESKSRALEEEP